MPGEAKLVKLEDIVDQTTDFEKLFGKIGSETRELTVHCGEVRRINSAGIRAWTKYFERLGKTGVRMKFIECSPSIVQAMGLMKDLLAGGEVSSLYTPFSCEDCGEECQKLFTVRELASKNFQIHSVKCPSCGKKAKIDEVPSEYFSFLKRGEYQIVLFSDHAQDEVFVSEVARVCGFPLTVIEDAASVADARIKLDPKRRPVIFVDASASTHLGNFRAVFSERLTSGEVTANLIHFIAPDSWDKIQVLASAPTFGHIIFRPIEGSSQAGRHYGRIVRASCVTQGFGIENFLASNAVIYDLELEHTEERKDLVQILSEYLDNKTEFTPRVREFVVNSVDELIMNAVAPADAEDGFGQLDPVDIKIGSDSDYVAVSVIDQKGKLDRQKLFFHLLKSYRDNSFQVDPVAAGQSLGLAITFRAGASMMFAIDENRRTEATVIFKQVDNWKQFRTQFHFMSVHVAE